MRWQQLDVLPPLDILVLIWLEEAGPALARRVNGMMTVTLGADHPGWFWRLEGEFDDVAADDPDRWAVITPPRL